MPTRGAERALPVVALIAGILLITLGVFTLDSLAVANEAWHWIQHGLLCGGGLAIGIAATLLHAAGQRSA